MRKSVIAFLVFSFAFPVLASAQTYYRPYYQQVPLAKTQTISYFLENRTGSPLHVTLLVTFPTGAKEWWPFDIAPNSEVFANIPFGLVKAKVVFAEASVPKGNKIVSEKAGNELYYRQEEDGRVLQGWWFFRK